MAFLLDFFRGKPGQLKRNDAFGAFAFRDSVYLWGGRVPSINYDQLETFLLGIQQFSLSSGKWTGKKTTGWPPLGIAGHCCSVIGDQAYYFGGYSLFRKGDFHNSITQLSIDTLHWKRVQETNPDLPVMRRACGGMVSFECNGKHHLLIIGGIGLAPAKPVPGTEYWLCQKDDVLIDATTLYQTNEHSMYDISEGRWSNPAIIGECMPPARGFVIEGISNCRAVIFGGCAYKNGVDNVKNDVYLLEIAVDNVQWQQLKQPGPDQQPSKRFFCGATIITSIGYPILVITGGLDENYQAINDGWFFGITDHTWTKITDIPQSVCERDNHSLSAFTMAPYHVWLITVGGIRGKGSVENITDSTMLTELAFKDGQWLIGDSFNFNTEGKFQVKCYQQLQLTQKELLDVHQQLKKTEVANEQATSLSNVELKEKIIELEGKMEKYQEERERELLENQAIIFHLNEEMEEREENFHQQQEEIEKAHQQQLQEKETELNESLEALQEVMTQWVIDSGEVTLTEEKLGKGSYSKVRVGIFRGLRVAVKSLHDVIISDYNLGLFSREMNMASRIRHPNLVQFIGATKVEGTPLILTELMSTSLYKELQKKEPLTKQQILSIAQDVALGLNYLHLFKPQPIIHRDISSPNVLLDPAVNESGYKAKVADYGTANLYQSTNTTMPGNAAYAAPEAIDPNQHSPAMDVYSYSVLLMEMIIREPPARTIVERKNQITLISLTYAPFKNLIIEKGLDCDQKNRPTMSEILKLLFE